MPGHRDDCQMRQDLDCLAELRIIDEIEFEDCEGITVLPGVEQVLSALSKERFIHAESVTQGKPHPAPYLAGAALLGYKPENCVVFEDAASGSRQAGLPAARWWRRRFRILSSR
jgi:sugar-phosphatase